MATCDEMRDHLFQLLRPKYFRKWKQRHQVYYKCVPQHAGCKSASLVCQAMMVMIRLLATDCKG